MSEESWETGEGENLFLVCGDSRVLSIEPLSLLLRISIDLLAGLPIGTNLFLVTLTYYPIVLGVYIL